MRRAWSEARYGSERAGRAVSRGQAAVRFVGGLVRVVGLLLALVFRLVENIVLGVLIVVGFLPFVGRG